MKPTFAHPAVCRFAARTVTWVAVLSSVALSVAFAQNAQEAEECLLALGKASEKHDG